MSQLNSITDYWNKRASGYSNSVQSELKDVSQIRWVNAINRYAPSMNRLKVLDIGCGPGLFSIMMATCAHDVMGVDYSEEMLKEARVNAKECNQDIEFVKMDAQNLGFADETFDLIVTRNVTWCLEDPKKAYTEWFRVLKKGGRVVNFDANHYLDRFDKDYKGAVKEIREQEKVHHDKFLGEVDVEIINDIALSLPLSKVKRPNWDYDTLTAIGAHVINVELFDHMEIEKANREKEFYANSFVISAMK